MQRIPKIRELRQHFSFGLKLSVVLIIILLFLSVLSMDRDKALT